MKTFSSATVLSLLLALVFSFTPFDQVDAQKTYEQFLIKEGVSTLAFLAHPSNNYRNSTYEFVNDGAIIKINYDGGISTKLKINIDSYGWVTNIRVLSDNDWFPPFFGIELTKDILYEYSGEVSNSSEITSSYEKFFNKMLSDFSGKDMTMLVMTLGWISF